jgi:hypothetical protein
LLFEIHCLLKFKAGDTSSNKNKNFSKDENLEKFLLINEFLFSVNGIYYFTFFPISLISFLINFSEILKTFIKLSRIPFFLLA